MLWTYLKCVLFCLYCINILDSLKQIGSCHLSNPLINNKQFRQDHHHHPIWLHTHTQKIPFRTNNLVLCIDTDMPINVYAWFSSKIQVLPDITSYRLLKDNNQQVDLTCLLKKTWPEDVINK